MSLFSTGSINTLSALWQLGKITVDRAQMVVQGFSQKDTDLKNGMLLAV